jgi:hypothetical protein
MVRLIAVGRIRPIANSSQVHYFSFANARICRRPGVFVGLILRLGRGGDDVMADADLANFRHPGRTGEVDGGPPMG